MRYAEYVQQIKYLKYSINDIENILNDRPIKRWAYLVHDKDIDEETGQLKEPHLHIEMHFNSDQDISTIASWFNENENRIEKGKSKNKKYIYENMCSYLVHETPSSDGKYKYPHEDVIANFDFIQFMIEIKQGVEKAKTKKHPIEDILQMICNNEIPRLKLKNHITDMQRIRYNKDIELAYKIRDEKIACEVNRNMNVVFITGKSGTGKTTLAKQFAMNNGFEYFVSGSSNDPLQGYQGQECVILDDIRGSDWKINDLLKMLDNHTNSLVKSRYSNKLMNDCKLMILTSVQDIDDLYNNLKENESEPIEQLKRRCQTFVDIDNKWVHIYKYNQDTLEYELIDKVKNTTKFMHDYQKGVEIGEKIVDFLTDTGKRHQEQQEHKIKSAFGNNVTITN